MLTIIGERLRLARDHSVGRLQMSFNAAEAQLRLARDHSVGRLDGCSNVLLLSCGWPAITR